MQKALKAIAGFSLAAALTGCATTANYEKILESWVGSNADELIFSWGPPHNSSGLSGGGRVLEYSSSSTGTVTTPIYGGGWVSIPYTEACKTLFMVDESGTIIKWRWTGNACTAHDPTSGSAPPP
ncbi:MAG: hypothetical protein OD918_02270 [Gammaproteobacteria bacterium]